MRVGSLVQVINYDGYLEAHLIGQIGLVLKIKPSLARKEKNCFWVLMPNEELEVFYQEELEEIS